jgi:guanylate kinase
MNSNVIMKLAHLGINANKTRINPETLRQITEGQRKKYQIIALVGEAGSGKDTLLKKILSRCPHLHEIVSCTTRPPREGEVNGINYHFMSPEVFGDKVINGEMLEASCFNEWFYGTGYESLRSDCVNIGVFNPEGIESLLAHPGVAVDVYYIKATDKERLLRQLNREVNPDVQEIIRRFKADMIDFEDLNFTHFELPNNNQEDLEYSVNYICDIYAESRLDSALQMPKDKTE